MSAVVGALGRYEILEEIGRGGTATVFRARQTDLRRTVALKQLNAFSAADPTYARRFVRESWVSASLSHPNVVTVHDYFEDGGTPYIAMEYLPYGSLRTRVGTLTPGMVAGVLQAILAGLGHAHERGIVHRDLKPENVLVTAEGDVKIADFGIAKALDSMETALTVTGTTIGTPTYMAPEQARAGEVGPWTDLYALGIMSFELIAGRPPFGASDPVAILISHVKDRPPPLTRVAAGTDPALSAWVAGLLEKDPGDRPASAGAAWDALEEIVLETLGPRWRRGGRLPSGTETPTTVPVTTPTQHIDTMDPALLTTLPPRPIAEPVAAAAAAGVAAGAAAAPAAAATTARKRPGWRVALLLIVAGWAVAALLMAALANSGNRTPSTPAGATATPPAGGNAPPAAGATPAPQGAAEGAPAAAETPAATRTPAPESNSGVGDSQSDDPSDDAPEDNSGVGDSRSDDPSDDEPDGPEP